MNSDVLIEMTTKAAISIKCRLFGRHDNQVKAKENNGLQGSRVP